jgi:hypothetical protein
MKRLTMFTLLVVVLLSFALTASAYQVISSHPRLYFTAADLPALRAKCSGPLASDYQVMKSWCDDHMSDSLPLASPEFYESHLAAYSFVWLMSGDTSYAARAKTIANYVISHGQQNMEQFTRGGSYFFDWCYDYLTPSERQTIGAAMVASGQYHLDTNNWDQMINYHSKPRLLRTLTASGLAVYGEGIADADAKELCDVSYEHTFGADHTLCAIDEIAGDGSYFEGDYTGTVLTTKYREHCEMWASATDADPFEVSGNFQNMPTYYLYEVFAKNGPGVTASMSGSRQGDSHNHTMPAASIRIAMYSLAKRYQDPRAQWLAEEIEAQGLGYILSYDRWKIIVEKDTNLTAQSPAGLPDSWYFQTIGTVYMRSGWDYSESSDDVYAVFRCEKYPPGHTHAHQNHLFIARGNDLLAIDSGTYDFSVSSHHFNYFERTIAHNTITVYDPSETTFGSHSNDGGQIPPSEHVHGVFCGDASLPVRDRGHIASYRNNDVFTYAIGDATKAYASYKLDLFTRDVVWVKPNTFVILDRVHATSASYEKKWLLHSLNEPQISGDTAVIQEGDSKLFVRTIMPSPFQMTKIGGAGHEFDVNGVNYAPSGGADSDHGAWRIEVRPTTSAEEHLFLHVLYVADASMGSMPAVDPITTDDVVGVEIEGNVVVFSRSGDPLDPVMYDYEYER